MVDRIYSYGKSNTFVNEGLMRLSKGQTLRLSDHFRQAIRQYYTEQSDGTISYGIQTINQKAPSSEGGGTAAPGATNIPTPSDNTLGTLTAKEDSNGDSYLLFKFSTDPAADDLGGDRRMTALAGIINSRVPLLDFHFNFQKPIDYPIAKEVNKSGRMQYIKVDSNYNFLAPKYEKFMSTNPTVSNNILPNFYATYAQAMYRQNNVISLNSLGNNFSSSRRSRSDFFSALDNTIDSAPVKDGFLNYFQDFAQTANNVIKSTGEGGSIKGPNLQAGNRLGLPQTGQQLLASIGNSYDSYIFSNNALPLLTTESQKGELFPLYNRIEFSTDENSLLSDALWELGVGSEIIKEVIKGTPQTMKFGNSAQSYSPSLNKTTPPSEKYLFNQVTLKVWDIEAWIQEKIFANGATPGVSIGVQLREPVGGQPGNQSAYGEEATKTFLAAKINRISKNKYQTLERLFQGKPAYSEAVFYKVQKFLDDDLTTPVCTYFIPNSSQMEECKFIDTQVKYGKKYSYTITSYVMVMGTEYSYNNFNQISPTEARIEVGTIPKMKLVEIPTATVMNMLVLDNPPIAPESLIVSFKNIGNKVLINLNGSTGNRDMIPVILESSDETKVESQRIAQRTALYDNKIQFRSDDAPGSFEIFRTTKRPASYKDFEGNKIRVVSTGGDATSAAMEDNIIPDIKYYYIFRTIDIHGNISNPTPVYEVEMKTSAGPPYMILNTIDFREEESKSKRPFKSMKRYIQILPTTTQGLLNVEESNLLEATTVKGIRNVVLGVSDEKLWGKKFRFRFTSKKTGRKIDLDVNFRAEHQLKQS
jgi:hypothetical protein